MPSQAAQAARPDSPQPPVSVNGTAPAAETGAAGPEDCPDCVTKAERALAIIGVCIGLVIAGIAIDLGTGGKLSALVGLGRERTIANDDTDAGA
jgi:hypothetical protein